MSPAQPPGQTGPRQLSPEQQMAIARHIGVNSVKSSHSRHLPIKSLFIGGATLLGAGLMSTAGLLPVVVGAVVANLLARAFAGLAGSTSKDLDLANAISSGSAAEDQVHHAPPPQELNQEEEAAVEGNPVMEPVVEAVAL
jgi:hypothetical protein